MNNLILYSYAKLNLYLEVLNKRKDGYHNIRTLFERISLFDKIILKLRCQDNKIRVICNSKDLPKDETKNLVYLSAKLLQDSLQVKKGVDIRLIKRIPVGAGLGGGSSNAAAVLLGLNKLWGLRLNRDKLLNYARRLGSDVPFFIYPTSFAQAHSRGDIVKPVKMLNAIKVWHILVVPRISVSTPYIYKKWDSYSVLTSPRCNVKIFTLALKNKDLSFISDALFNGLEEVSIKLYPEIRRIRNKLLSLGLKAILMSGSGPAVFGIVFSRKEAASLSRQLRREKKSWEVFVVRTI